MGKLHKDEHKRITSGPFAFKFAFFITSLIFIALIWALYKDIISFLS